MIEPTMSSTRESSAAATAPVARVLPLLGLPQLDRLFDYLVPKELADQARPGVRVRLRFHGQLVNGIIIERAEESEHEGPLAYLKDVISPEVVYPESLRRLVDSLAQYYGGCRSDIIRAAIPSRHARAERSRNAEERRPTWEELGALPTEDPDLSEWDKYAFGSSFIGAVRSGQAARAAWQPVPGEDVHRMLAQLAVTVAREGGGVLIVVPDARALARLESALRAIISPRQITVLGSTLSPESRYRRYLDILHGQGRLVIGTRSAAFAPVGNLRLAVLVDDGDDNLVDPRAPYVHAREVLVTRASQEKCGLLLASASRTAEVQSLVAAGWLHNLVATPEALVSAMPEMVASNDSIADPENISRSRLPAGAFKHARAALREQLPVLVQVPRKGYVPTLSCTRCGAPARCKYCNGPLGIPSTAGGEPAPPTCRWCGRIDVHHSCHSCGSTRIRPTVVGSERTAEELGLAFRPHPVVNSSGDRVVDSIPEGARVVVATPGAEPTAPHGYGATLILDTWAMLGRQDLRATEDALANWSRAVMLTRSRADGGAVVIDADAALPVVSDLLAWDHVGAAARELADRSATQLPPAFHVAVVDGTSESVARFRSLVALPKGTEVLGPVDLPMGTRPPAGVEPGTPIVRLLIRVNRAKARELGIALKKAQGVSATRKDPDPVRVIVDPIRFG